MILIVDENKMDSIVIVIDSVSNIYWDKERKK